MRKLFCFLLTLGCLLSLLAGCHPDSGSTPSDSTAEESEAILADDLTKYKVVCSSEADKTVVAAARSLAEKIKVLWGISLTVKDDFVREGSTEFVIDEYEILVGDCNREESTNFQATLRAQDFGYRLAGKKLVVAGTNSADTAKAVNALIERCLKEKTDVFYSASQDLYERGTYDCDSLTLNGTSIADYALVYPLANKNGEKLVAEAAQATVLEKVGYRLPVVADSAFSGENAILFGDVKASLTAKLAADKQNKLTGSDVDNGYYLGGVDGYIWISASSHSGIRAGNAALLNSFFPESQKNVTVKVSEGEAVTYAAGDTLSIMSFNVLVVLSDDAGHGGQARKELVSQQILSRMPDTVGVQEASAEWITYLSGALSEYYAYVGKGRDNGEKGETCAVFYRKDKFDLISTETYWLSDYPTIPGTKLKNSQYIRIMTYAYLKRKSDGKKFVHVNTHLDFNEAGLKQAEIMLKLIQKQNFSCPIFITGDFNSNAYSETYATICAGGFSNSSNLADSAKLGATFHAFGKDNQIVDFVFVKNNSVAIRKYEVCDELFTSSQITTAMHPSDHNAVLVEYQFLK